MGSSEKVRDIRDPLIARFLTRRYSSVTSRALNDTPLYKDPKASIEDRVADLLPRMSLAEKVRCLRLIGRAGPLTPSLPIPFWRTPSRLGLSTDTRRLLALHQPLHHRSRIQRDSARVRDGDEGRPDLESVRLYFSPTVVH